MFLKRNIILVFCLISAQTFFAESKKKVLLEIANNHVHHFSLRKPMKYQYSAGIIVYREENGEIQYLLLNYIAGHWDLAKGKLEAGETKKQAAIRELQEETGITNIKLREGFEESLSYIFRDFDGLMTNKTVSFFVGETNEKKVVLSHEHKGYVWLPYDHALDRLTYQNAKDIFKDAHQFMKSLQ